jgi:1,4-dihydroxy-2-naphthoate octaprenyltransferase
MWRKALTSIPRPTKQEWEQSDIVTRWLIVTRAAVLIITFLSSSIAGILAYRDGLFDLKLWVLVTLGLMFAHATNNLLNDYIDWEKGIDRNNYFRNQYGSHPMTLMSKERMHRYILFTGLTALFIGLYLCYLRGEVVVYLTIAGAFFLLFYTWPLKYMALGEVAVFIVWGILMIGGGYYTITNRWSADVVLISVPYSISVTTIIFGKHIDKLKADQAKGVYTLPVVLGERMSQYGVILMIAVQYIITTYLVLTGVFAWPMLAFMAVAFAVDLHRKIFLTFLQDKPKERPANYPEHVWPLWFVAYAFAHNSAFGTMFLLGLIVDVVSKTH